MYPVNSTFTFRTLYDKTSYIIVSCVIYSRMRIVSSKCMFQVLGRCEVGAMAVPHHDRRALLAPVRHGAQVTTS